MINTSARMIVVMGVSGCGKSTIGKALADQLAGEFIDGDDLHPNANKLKMASGVPLTDADREPWLSAICDEAVAILSDHDCFVVACSALKRIYRERLRSISYPVMFLHLHGPRSVIAERQAARKDHFMPPELLDSQYDALESPALEPGVIEISVDQSIKAILHDAISTLKR